MHKNTQDQEQFGIKSLSATTRGYPARAHLGRTTQSKPHLKCNMEIEAVVPPGLAGGKKDHPDCSRRNVQKPASVLVWGGVSACGTGNPHICEDGVDAERRIQTLNANYFLILACSYFFL